ncbi:MAG: hypothetical protein M0P47_09385 [Bacteroidales bacterium]|nr:hypothetical protein [Bacteroidales bacterium]
MNLLLRIRFTYLVLTGYFKKPHDWGVLPGYNIAHRSPFSLGWQFDREFWQPCESWGCVKDEDNPYIIWKDEQREITADGLKLTTDLNRQ